MAIRKIQFGILTCNHHHYHKINYTFDSSPMNIFDSDRGPIWPRSESDNRFYSDEAECGADLNFFFVFGADLWPDYTPM